MEIPICPNCNARMQMEHLEPGEMYTVTVPDYFGPADARRVILLLQEQAAKVSEEKCPVFIVVHQGFDIARVPAAPDV